MTKRKNISHSDAALLLFAVICLAVKLFLMKDVKIVALTTSGADDALMVHIAEQLTRLNWFGAYNQCTLVKGCFFPVFLGISHLLHVDYISFVQIFYAAACLMFVLAIKPSLRFRAFPYIIYILLLFNPILASSQVIQRVYRNSITPMQVLLIFGGYLGVYIRCAQRDKSWIKWLAIGGFGFLSLWLTREDAVWALPFILAASLFIAIRLWKEFGKQSFKRILSLASPFICLLVCIKVIALLNGLVYGIFTENELTNSAFSDTMKALYAIDAGEEQTPYVSVSREKLRMVYEVSPAMASIEPEMETMMDEWSVMTGREEINKEQKEVENGWFFWVLREAVAEKGYYTNGKDANAFYEQAASEINQAFADGRLEKQAAMPSALMPPWKKGMLGDLLLTMIQAADYVSSYQDCYLLNDPSTDDGGDGIARFEWISGRKATATNSDSAGSAYALENAAMSRLTDIWSLAAIPVKWLGRACFLVLVILFFLRKLDSKESALLLGLTGLLGGLFCLYGGVAYNELRSCWSITYMYLSGAYPMAEAFHLLSIAGICQWGYERFSDRIQKSNQ